MTLSVFGVTHRAWRTHPCSLPEAMGKLLATATATGDSTSLPCLWPLSALVSLRQQLCECGPVIRKLQSHLSGISFLSEQGGDGHTACVSCVIEAQEGLT